MRREPMAVPVRDGVGTACASARMPRFWEGEAVPVLAGGYVETEHFVSGSARTYTGPVPGPVPTTTGDIAYRTRVLIRRPTNASEFSGRVVVEPFNTSFGEDRDALWARVGGLLQAQGDAWVGITTRAMGAAELTKADPTRYAEINFPINDFGWDALRDLGVLIRTGGENSPLEHLEVHRLYLGGYSQSAVDVATFAMAFHDTARLSDGAAIFDGYFPAARAASFAALASGDAWRPPMEYLPMRDVDVPVIEVQPQSDVEGFCAQIGSETFVNPGSASVRRADSDFTRGSYRLYELAGAPHVAFVDGCEGAGSSFPTSAFVRAAMHLLFRWVEEGESPPRARRITTDGAGTVTSARVDRCGNPLGGVRSPHLDVPLARYQAHSDPGPMCQLVGRETPLSSEVLADRYRDVHQYLSEFTAALDATVRAGFILRDDRDPILSDMAVKAADAFAAVHIREVVIP